MRREFWAVLAFCFLAARSFAAITGIVMTTEGQPVAGARVSIRAFESREASRTRILSASPEAVPIASVQTDAKGAFSLDSPKEPTVDLTVYARGYTPVQRQIERDEELGAIALEKAEMRNGSVTAGGKPVAGAKVAVYYNSDEYLTKTDDQGRYEAPDPQRSWSIVVVHPDYAIGEDPFDPFGSKARVLQRTLVAGSAFQGRAVSGEKDAPVAGAVVLVDGWPLATTGEDGTFTIAHMPPKWKTISARKDTLLGRRTFSKDASATIRLARGATISGRVTDAKTRGPVGGAAITAGPRQYDPGSDFGPAAITDAKGIYSLVVPAGAYRVFAWHPGYSGDPADASAAMGQQLSRDLVLSPLARVSGVVQDESNRPVVAAMLDAEDAESSRMGTPPFRMRGPYATVSGPDGRFSKRIPPDQDLSMLATKRGMPPAKSDLFRLAAGERKTGLVLTIPNGIAVSGRTIDTHGQPLAGVGVTAAEVEGGQHGGMGRRFAGGMPGSEEDAVLTASDGTFTMRMKEGTYDFAFRREGLAPKTVRGQTISAASASAVDATMEPSVDITGRVTRAGTGVENVMIMTMVADTSTASATTGPDGSFTLRGLAAGTIRLMAQKPNDFIDEARNVTAPAQNVVIEVPAGGRITGRVVEKESGKPIPSFQAGITTPQGRATMMSQLRGFNSDDGSFTLDSVPPGAAVLVASASGYASTRLNVTVEDGKEIKGVELQLELGVTLAGRVTDSSGAAVSDVQVHMFPAQAGGFAMSRTSRTATTDPDGQYSIDGLEAGFQTISFSHASHAAVQKSVTLKGHETRLDVQLPSGGRVTGTVVTASGAPVAGAQVDATGLDSQSTRTNADGAFEFESMTPGHYRFSARSAGLVEGVIEDADVSTGAPVRIVLKAGGTVYGSVTGLSATELAQAQVSVSSGQFWTEGVVNAAGNYRIEGIPDGSVQVGASMGQTSGSTRHSAPQTVELAPGGSQQVDLAFHDGATVRGRVTHNGVPFAGARISFLPRFESGGISMTMTGEDGQYSVDGLDNGEYTVSVTELQSTNYSTSYQVHGSATFDFDYKTGSLHGRVIDVSSNEPLSNATVFLRNTSRTLFRMPLSAVTDATGAFVVESVEPGSYTVTARKDGYGNEVKEITVGDSTPQDVEFRLARN